MKFPFIISMKLENFLDFHEFLGVRQANRKKQDETRHPVFEETSKELLLNSQGNSVKYTPSRQISLIKN